jgi:hypothetical protein
MVASTTSFSSVDLFLESIKSAATRATYKQSLNQFKEDTGFDLTQYNNDKKKNNNRSNTRGGEKVLQNKIIEYIVELKRSGASYSRINVIISALQSYCDAYDIEEVNFDKVRKYMPEHVRKVRDRAYTKHEIRTLLEYKSTSTNSPLCIYWNEGRSYSWIKAKTSYKDA